MFRAPHVPAQPFPLPVLQFVNVMWLAGHWACTWAEAGAVYSLFGSVVRDGPVQGDAVAELRIVPIFLVLALHLLAVITQAGRQATLAQAPRPLHQAHGLGQTWWK